MREPVTTSITRTARALGAAGAGALLALPSAGCAAREVRDSARLLSAYTQSTQREAEQFAKHRDAVAQARTRNLGFIEESALAAEQRGAEQMLVWRLTGDQTRLTLYQGILEGTARAAEQQQELAARRDEHAKAVAAARGGVSVRQAQLAKSAQATAQLAQKPDLKKEKDFYAAFFKDVRKHVKEAQDSAAKDAGQAAAAAAAAKSAETAQGESAATAQAAKPIP